ncbi:MAG: glycosyltransferase [Microbacterium sp.]
MVSSRVRDISRAVRRMPGVGRLLESSDPQRRARLIADSGLVDTELYAAQLGVEAITVPQAAWHYATEGFLDGLTVNVLIDPAIVQRELFRTDRPAIYDYLAARAWRTEVSELWSVADYLDAHPGALEAPLGPVGHLWQRLRADDRTLVTVLPGGSRRLPWHELRPVLREASAEQAALLRGRRARHARTEQQHPRDLGEVAIPASGVLVSIVLPTWNRAGGLRRAVESVIAQSWPWWQLIIVDDGSWDDTADIARLVTERDERIEFVPRVHEGVCATRNAGIARATGEYIAFLDSDNAYQPHFLRDMVTSLVASGAESAFATTEIVDGDGTARFRYGSPSIESLREGNSIDLNVLVAKTSAVREVGGFDEALRRAVDYDLVLRLAARSTPVHVPTIGVVYDNAEDADDRISVSEALGWNTEVRLRHAPGRAAGERQQGTSVIQLTQPGDPQLRARLEVLAAPRDDVQIAAVGPLPHEWRAIAVASHGRAHLGAHLFAQDEPWAYVANLSARAATRDRLLFLDACTWPSGEQLDALIAAGASTGAFQPVTSAVNGTIASAGSVFVGPQRTPARLLLGHPVEDAQARGDAHPVPALSGRTLGLDAAAFERAGGFDPMLFNAFEAEGLSLRLRAADDAATFTLLPHVVLHQAAQPTAFTVTDERGTAQQLRTMTRAAAPSDIEEHYAPTGLVAHAWRQDGAGMLRPTLTRPRRTIVLDDGTVAPRLRWSIRTAAPAGPHGAGWGDTHFASSLARALRQLGQDAVVDAREADERPTRSVDDVRVVLRGLDAVAPAPGQLSLMWVISHPDLVTRAEAAAYDGVFAASLSWSRTQSERWGIDIAPLLQCTDQTIFHPRGLPRGGDILFVGNSRGIPRPTVMAAVRGGIPLALYGGDWERFVPAEAVTGERVENSELGTRYEQAGVVLNDHWADMKREGFISNRVFDVVAAGGRVFSDEVDGIDEIFGAAVHTFSSVGEIAPALSGDLDGLFGSHEELAAISARVRAEHTFQSRARTLLDAAIAAGV